MGELQTARGQETGDETNSEQTRHGATEAVTRTTNSKGSEYGAGAMNCSRPGWLILLHRMPWTQGNWLPCPWQRPRTRGSTPGSGCGRCARRHYQTLLSVLIHLQCLEPLPLQAVHSSKSARLCLTRTGLRTRQPKGSRTTCSLGFEHTPAAGNLRTITGTHPRLGAKTQLSTL